LAPASILAVPPTAIKSEELSVTSISVTLPERRSKFPVMASVPMLLPGAIEAPLRTFTSPFMPVPPEAVIPSRTAPLDTSTSDVISVLTRVVPSASSSMEAVNELVMVVISAPSIPELFITTVPAPFMALRVADEVCANSTSAPADTVTVPFILPVLPTSLPAYTAVFAYVFSPAACASVTVPAPYFSRLPAFTMAPPRTTSTLS